jgi:hypothetical protein
MSKTKDKQIDMLLTFMKDEIELNGSTSKTCHFNFNRDEEDFLAFKEKTELSEDKIDRTLKICRSRGYIKYYCMGGGELYNLTTEGHGRAISVEAAENYTEKSQQQTVTIGTIQGPTQIGNNNTQNIEGIFEYLIGEIDSSNASEEQKKEAKNLLQKALAHPVTSAIIGSSVGAIISMLGG